MTLNLIKEKNHSVSKMKLMPVMDSKLIAKSYQAD